MYIKTLNSANLIILPLEYDQSDVFSARLVFYFMSNAHKVEICPSYSKQQYTMFLLPGMMNSRKYFKTRIIATVYVAYTECKTRTDSYLLSLL